ncbi:hypothetical protein ACFSX9_13050 [Flavobacterium ardleyense]|uniref:Uncharacterized protein n=1 Tax=Flavobacterium ardleyense TaxID=2038737 RepID=A0ABW5ZA78_9FLAO
MDELEILKKDWKKNENVFDQVTEKEIYGMLHKRSSSIVKWILIISILELVLWNVISFLFPDDSYAKTTVENHLDKIVGIIEIFNYVVIVFFIYLFYKNYRAINTRDTVKELMNSILKTRKTVQYYVWYNVGMVSFLFVLGLTYQFMYDSNMQKLINQGTQSENSGNFQLIFVITIFVIVALIFIGLIWLFYRLLYGILMKRLQKNYYELKKIDF